jgi:hypothetical protein
MAEGYRKNGGYIVTSKKNGISAYNAMKTPFQWETPEFIKEKIASGE